MERVAGRAPAGRVRLAVDFHQPLPSQEPKRFALPLVAADGVVYQSGLAAVEGCAELEVQIDTPARRVDVGRAGRGRLPNGPPLVGRVWVRRRSAGGEDRRAAPPKLTASIRRSSSNANWIQSLAGRAESKTQARFKLRTKAVYLQVKLPPGAELWSAELDGTPLKPQRQGESILIDVPAGKADAAQTLQIVYAAPVSTVGLRGTVDVPSPKLLLRAQQDSPLPQAGEGQG